ncbi:MAG TPA: rhodanese-like domain-containing protein [Polyangia bacterium]|nr:rhodanese-like domain-containing protein [Polyangia bacterium]
MPLDEITPRALKAMLDGGAPVYLLDVRQPWEHELVALADRALIPLDQLAARVGEVKPAAGELVVTYCHHGVRSLHAAAILLEAGVRAASLKGGIDAWSALIDPTLRRY